MKAVEIETNTGEAPEKLIRAERNEGVFTKDVAIVIGIVYGRRIVLTREQAMEFGSRLVELAEPIHGGTD